MGRHVILRMAGSPKHLTVGHSWDSIAMINFADPRLRELKQPGASQDNGHSFAGLYGLANPIVTWLIGRGFGELVALTPEEMRKAVVCPPCPSKRRHIRTTKGWRVARAPGGKPVTYCGREMRYRSEGFVCYEHPTPIRRKRPPRLQKLPAPPFKTWDVIGRVVEVVYRMRPGRARGEWIWLVDGQEWLRPSDR